jgi:hypothetical protein
MLEQLPALVNGVVSDLLTAAQLPVAGTAGFLASAPLASLLRRRLEGARDILLEELRTGRATLPPEDLDDGVAVLYRYLRAAQEGTARINLRLMAKIIAGCASLGRLRADEFLHDADMIASLRYEEIVLLTTVHRIQKANREQQQTEDSRGSSAFSAAAGELVPTVFRDVGDWQSTAAALIRTGLVTTKSVMGGVGYVPTSKLDRLMDMASFESVLGHERRT